MDGFHILMQDAVTKGLCDPANFCIPKKMFRKKGTIGWLIDNKLISIFEGSTLQVKSLEFEWLMMLCPRPTSCSAATAWWATSLLRLNTRTSTPHTQAHHTHIYYPRAHIADTRSS
jgi:hypothetical protein